MTTSAAPAELIAHLRARVVDEVAGDADALDRRRIVAIVNQLLRDERRVLPEAAQRLIVQAVVDETLGLGPLDALLRDPSVTEIMVNGHDNVFVERSGCLERSNVRFTDDAHVLHVIDRILSPLGRRVDEASPMVDARLPDGSRINAIISPLSLQGPVLTVRRFGTTALTCDELVALGTMNTSIRDVLRLAVRAKRNILVIGGTGSGKTTTLAALTEFVDETERVITIEDAAELRLSLPHVVRLESRPASLEGRGEIPIRMLVRNALRMRPDRIVVGEVRGGEAVDMLAAMTTGHEGSLSTLHASSAADALRRLRTLALMGDIELPYAAVAEQVANAIDIVVNQARLADGSRRIVEVTEVAPEAGDVRLTPLVGFRPDGWDAGRIIGRFHETDALDDWVDRATRDAGLAGRR